MRNASDRPRARGMVPPMHRRGLVAVLLACSIGGSSAAIAVAEDRTGGPGKDDFDGTAAVDHYDGRGGDDRLEGKGGDDELRGGPGIDVLSGDAGNDTVDGGGGNDTLLGGAGRDRLIGGPGKDVFIGGSGNDTISARDGVAEDITCGRGRDRVTADRADRVGRDCESVRRG